MCYEIGFVGKESVIWIGLCVVYFVVKGLVLGNGIGGCVDKVVYGIYVCFVIGVVGKFGFWEGWNIEDLYIGVFIFVVCLNY